MKETKQDI